MGFTTHFWKCKECEKSILYTSKQKHPSLTHLCYEGQLNKIIGFQIYLNEKGLITNYDWDFEKEAKTFLKIIKL
jgi:hypothetical protein